MIIRGLTICLALISAVQTFGQESIPLSRQAALQCRQGELTQALETITGALETDESKDPFCWYVKGYIHKQIFVDVEKESPGSQHREDAISSIEKAMTLDSTGEHLENCHKAIRFLAITYYNDAIWGTRSFEPDAPEGPEQSFARFKEVIVKVIPDYDFTENTVDFYKHMGGGYIRHYKNSDRQKRELMDASIAYYKRALEVDSTDYESNYNLAINYYNLGVQRIKKINHNTDIFALLAIQDECVILFEQSLPYMLEAQRQNPERVETLKGLMAIYRALSDYEKFAYYKDELEQRTQKE